MTAPAVTQPGGGEAVRSDFWLGVDCAIVGGAAAVLRASSGLSVVLVQDTTTEATLTVTGRVGGSVRLEIDPGGDDESTVFVLEFVRTSLGVAEAVRGLPLEGEIAGERQDGEAWDRALDEIVQDLQDRVAALEP